ncbi:alpha/beta fold hydrolase [Sphaerotilus sp.]|uniref:alpha/beta fold hydrolase n=1 Tax=Sphaerotilus sp. TaxID=2093942 RepID=UPI00286DD0E6|nr:alpha/beta fold hydrolase [Sphaerotilus sp.]
MAHLPYPITKGHWLAPEVRFHTGEVMPTLRMAYTTLGNPDGEPVLVLHGTNGSAASLLTPAFAGALFGPGQPLDARHHRLILPDAIGAGASAKPSDGLRTAFPRYHYGDMVDAQHRLLTEHLGVYHLRAVIGYSMGGTHAWLWAQRHPQCMDAIVPLAALPAAMSGRNWMLRRLLIEAIRSDPEWQGGHYTRQPRSLQWASAFHAVATNGGCQGWQKLAPSRDRADALVEQRLNAPFLGDANDHLYQWDAARDYDPTPDLERIEAAVLAINSADDERNPPELGLLDAAMKRLRHGRALLLPGSPDTTGHSTVLQAARWTPAFADFLAQVPRRTSPS